MGVKDDTLEVTFRAPAEEVWRQMEKAAAKHGPFHKGHRPAKAQDKPEEHN